MDDKTLKTTQPPDNDERWMEEYLEKNQPGTKLLTQEESEKVTQQINDTVHFIPSRPLSSYIKLRVWWEEIKRLRGFHHSWYLFADYYPHSFPGHKNDYGVVLSIVSQQLEDKKENYLKWKTCVYRNGGATAEIRWFDSAEEAKKYVEGLYDIFSL